MRLLLVRVQPSEPFPIIKGIYVTNRGRAKFSKFSEMLIALKRNYDIL